MNQINLNAKCWTKYKELAELHQNLMEGLVFPENLISRTMFIFLNFSFNNPRIQTLIETTKKTMMFEGFGTKLINARGENSLIQLFSNLLLSDFTAYYLALVYRIDPLSTRSNEIL